MSKRKFEIGDTAVVNSNIGLYDAKHHNVSAGTEVIIKGYETSFAGSGIYAVQTPHGNLIKLYSNQLDKTAGKTSIEKFQSLIDQAQDKIAKTKVFIAETEAKIAFLKEIGSDTFDENEFTAYHTLTIIEQGNMSKIEKAKAIAALISKK